MTSRGPCHKCNGTALNYSPPHKVWYCDEHSPFKEESLENYGKIINRSERRARRKRK